METKQEIFEHFNTSPAFHLATVEDGKPHVRGMLLFKADERGVIFHTGKFKDVFRQIQANPNVEICFFFFKNGTQYRMSGELVLDEDKALFEEIYNHPTRKFMRDWGEKLTDQIAVYRMPHGKITSWNMAANFDAKQYVEF